MQAVIVAGGMGTRLRPLTQHRPKHLLAVAGVPFVAHQIAKLAAAGVDRVVLATSYHADLFEPVLGDGAHWGLELAYVTEAEPLGTAGAIRNAASELASDNADPIVILNGDILSGHDLRAQVDHHREHGADVTLHLVEVDDARAYGCVPTADDGTVKAFLEKSPDPVSRQVNAGCYLFERDVLDSIPAGRAVSVERETFPDLLVAGRGLSGYVEQAYWLDVGTPAALSRASSDLVRGAVTSPAYLQAPGEAWIHPDAAMSATASVCGGTAVGAGARVGDGAVLESSVIDEGAAIDSHARLVDCVVGPAARIGRDVVLTGVAVGDRAVIGAGCELVDGARIWCDAEIGPGAIRFSSDV
ncbi:MAG: NDP-sugar synthase [Nocardioidaceae bacterium]